jgi:peptidoglycan/LPS O-acetylase OafA/YrhL
VAVLPVILFHAGFQRFGGGYIGVDVFFVISGYLITSIILTERAAGTFTIGRFYERRARRILPALFLVVMVCVPLAWRYLPQGEWLAFTRSVAALAVFASNILFWRETGYFDTATELKPLIHTWSLAVEEQYYVIYPLFLMLAWRLGLKGIAAVLVAVSIGSLLAAHLLVSQMPAATFYLLPFRGWELAMGGLAAIHLWRRPTAGAPTRVSEMAGVAGLSMIVVSVFFFSRSTPFPSAYALLPTGGAALIILFAQPGTACARLLGSAPFVSIGLVSYSAYLWHQPLFAFARHARPDGVGAAMLLGLAGLSLVLAYVSWRFVEQPFRNRAQVPRPAVIVTAVTGTLALVGGALAGQYTLPARKALDDLQTSASALRTLRRCALEGFPVSPYAGCRVFGAQTEPSMLLIGDSHAESIQLALQEALLARGSSAYSFTVGGCTPIKDVALDASVVFEPCTQMNRFVADRFLREHRMETIILMSRWTAHWTGVPFNNQEGGVEPRLFAGADGAVLTGLVSGTRTTDKRAIADLYRNTLATLAAQAKLVIVYPVPEMGWDAPRVIADHYHNGSSIPPELASISAETFRRRNAPIHELFDSITSPLIRIRPDAILCDTVVPDRCIAHQDGVPLYYDDDHLSDAGARLVVAAIMKAIDAGAPVGRTR